MFNVSKCAAGGGTWASFAQPQGTRRAAASKNHWQQQKKKKNLDNLRLTFYPSGRYMQSGQKQKIEIPNHLLTIFPQDSPRPRCCRW